MTTSTPITGGPAASGPADASTADGERADLLAPLAKHRHFLRFTTRDLTDEQARQRTTASELCLGGLIKHVTAVEQGWVNFIVEGPSAMSGFADMTEHDWARRADQFRLLPDETLAGVLAGYAEVARRTDELVASLPRPERRPPAAEGPLVPARRTLVGPPGAPAHHRRNRTARRPRRHHPRIPGRGQVHGVAPGTPGSPAPARTARPTTFCSGTGIAGLAHPGIDSQLYF